MECLMANFRQKVKLNCESLEMMWRLLVRLHFDDDAFDQAGDGDQVADTTVVSDRIAKR